MCPPPWPAWSRRRRAAGEGRLKKTKDRNGAEGKVRQAGRSPFAERTGRQAGGSAEAAVGAERAVAVRAAPHRGAAADLGDAAGGLGDKVRLQVAQRFAMQPQSLLHGSRLSRRLTRHRPSFARVHHMPTSVCGDASPPCNSCLASVSEPREAEHSKVRYVRPRRRWRRQGIGVSAGGGGAVAGAVAMAPVARALP